MNFFRRHFKKRRTEETQFLRGIPLTEYQVNMIRGIPVRKILEEDFPLAKRIFLKYLEKECGSPDLSLTKKNIEIYDLCKKILSQLHYGITPKEEIKKLCSVLKYDYSLLKDKVNAGDVRTLQSWVLDQQTKLCDEIDGSTAFKNFKLAIKAKLQNVEQ